LFCLNILVLCWLKQGDAETASALAAKSQECADTAATLRVTAKELDHAKTETNNLIEDMTKQVCCV